jgi:UDP-glucose 4-epimerase
MTHRILVTGGFGYVGGRVAMELASLPDTQIILGTRFPKDRPAWLPSASVIATDWNNTIAIEQACKDVDTILHFAAMNEIDAAKNPADALQMNGVATVRLVEAAKVANVKKFIYLSTAHVYGSLLKGYLDESVCPRPIHPYATSHRAAEDVVLAAHDAGKMTGLVIRLSNSFGTPAHPDVNRWTLLVNDLCKQAVASKKLKLHTHGLQRRDFITLTDVTRAITHMLRLDKEYLGNGIFNVGGCWSPTIIEIANLIAVRCEITLGYLPEIIRPEPIGNEIDQQLDYRIDKLKLTGFNLINNHKAEIDSTLLLCKQAFSN